ncbi:MAG: hypothetical protein J5812_03415 [Candidatus Methanomethylophilaceae archaeon]|nr:hypothetical protein [Candidatus Methanomethylophilaceae archaeon]
MVSVILPLDPRSLSSFLSSGVVPIRSRFAAPVVDGADKAFVCCGEEAMGPFEIVSRRQGALVCRVSEPVRKAQYRKIDVPMRLSDSAVSRIFSNGEAAPEYASVTGDSRIDGLLASSEDGVVMFASDSWDVIQGFTSLLEGKGISYSMRSASELAVDDKGLCERCRSIPVESRMAEDGFMCGFLAPKVDAGRVPGCPGWAVENVGGRVLVAKDRYGNPVISSMSAHIPPFDSLCTAAAGESSGGVPEGFRFAAAESVFVSALDMSGYSVERVWSDSLCSMFEAESMGSRLEIVAMQELCDSVVSQLKDHPVSERAIVVTLSCGIRAAPYSKVMPLLGVRGFDWSCTEGLFSDPEETGLELSGPVKDEMERALEVIWAVGPGSTED